MRRTHRLGADTQYDAAIGLDLRDGYDDAAVSASKL